MMLSSNVLPEPPRPASRLLDARLHLLDRQLLDDDGYPVGIVDDIDLEVSEAAVPRVTAILTGQVLFTRVFGRRPPRRDCSDCRGVWSQGSARWCSWSPAPKRSTACGSSTGCETTSSAVSQGVGVQLSELIGPTVHDCDGQRLGIIDVRLAVAGDRDGPPGRTEVFGLIVSPRTRSSYLGYERSDARRPVVLAALLRWRHRDTFLVLWADVSSSVNEGLTARPGFTRYSPVLRADD